MLFTILIILSIFWAINMGASGVAPSFCSSYGAKFIKRKEIILLFTLFVILGAIIFGHNVVTTISGGIVPAHFIGKKVAVIILLAASVSLFIANLLKIPQSTSWITVFSLIAVGTFFGAINYKKFYILIPAWIILPALSYFLSISVYKYIYPPRNKNFILYEKFFANEKKLKTLTILTNCYVAFAIGANNVANVVGPLKAAKVFESSVFGLFISSPLFGLGALLFGKGNLSSFGCDLVPLGLVTSAVVSLITATLLIVASVLGIPQSLVQLNAASIFAVSHIKNGFSQTTSNATTKKTVYVWIITPLLSFALTFILLYLGIGKH
jgi:sulfate permease